MDTSLVGYDGARNVRDEELSVGRKKLVRKSKSGSEKKSGPWRPTRRQVLWAVGTLLALVTVVLLVGLLVVNLDAVKREDLSRERIEQVGLFIGIAVAATTLIVLLAIGGASLGWTGFQGKTVWDFLQLLIVPLMLVAIGLVFALQQDARQQRVEEQRADAERKLADQRAQDEALQAYLNQMSGLMLDRGLRTSEEGASVGLLARARTITILRRLDSERNSDILQFLHEAQLISGTDPDVRLDSSNLSGATLSRVDLGGVDLSGADLSKAVLSETNLSRADLSRASLRGADLTNAYLSDADLSRANLSFADLRGADLSRANLINADLQDTNLSEANLSGANLLFAELPRADLRRANLRDATALSDKKIAAAKSLKGATMPDGQKYEDWLKDRENRQQDE